MRFVYGRVRGLLGDCTKVDAPHADAIVTDIPYEVSQRSAGLRDIDYGEWDKEGLRNVRTFLRRAPRAPNVFIFCGDGQVSPLKQTLRRLGYTMVRTFVWHKTNPSPMNAKRGFISACEFAVWGKLPGAFFSGDFSHNHIDGPVERGRKWHRTQKPQWLMRHILSRIVPPRGLVLDPFMGGASTLVAAASLGMRSVGIEKDRRTYECARERCRELGEGLFSGDVRRVIRLRRSTSRTSRRIVVSRSA